ncbi:helix-turn-helix transcriptional regulator [Nitrosomonas sp. Is37]|uniref:helix-turn-helix domain-containing protein n=1 Tax=Nitrosomonas sp. Is37 TaxID=3080535 RepID=UPI00294B61F3|nr:helix-turn-helix transcriptional regulator [Nitrosomonas sp. Is37]MDV6344779.1 helix-turn-helix transcriptional regulator [Nitrosomonas sp. Is37]
MNIKLLLGANIRQTREEKNWSQDKLSEKTGLHRTYISGIERGVRNPTIEIVQQIAIALEVPIADLFKDKNQK